MTPPTSFRAEPKGLVHIIVLGGGAPSVAVVPARGGASVILLSLKGEGEFARRTLSVATQGEKHCKTNIKKE